VDLTTTAGVENLFTITLTGHINCGFYHCSATNSNRFDPKILPLSHYEG